MKRIVYILLGIIALTSMVLLGLYFIPPGQTEYQYHPFEFDAQVKYKDKVGWYKGDDDLWYQITWSSSGSLRLNHFDTMRSELVSFHLIQDKDEAFHINKKDSNNKATFLASESEGQLLYIKDQDLEATLKKVDGIYYNQEEIRYFNKEVSLVGTLFTPIQGRNETILIFIHGSGISDRDNFWYMYQADYLAKLGYTVLLPDKRGCGKSQGKWHIASFSDFAGDIISGIDYLKESKGLKDYKIGVLGLSQGGWISHLVAEQSEEVDFVIDVVSSATTPNQQLHFEVKKDIEDGGVPSFISGVLSTVFSKRAMGRRKIWWDKNGDYDPIARIKTSKVPILKIYGSDDSNVPVKKSLENLKALESEHPELPLTIEVFHGSGHGLFNIETGWIRNDYLESINQWIREI